MLRALEDARLTGLTLESIAVACSIDGDPAEARALFRDALAVFRGLVAERDATLVTFNLAESEFQAGNTETAIELTIAALPPARKLNPHFVAAALGNVAAYLIALNRCDEALLRALDAHEMARDLQLDVFAVWTLQRFAAIAALKHQRYVPAARLLGFINARLAGSSAVRQYTEQQEYDRIMNALRRNFDAATLAALHDAGALMDNEVAIEEALASAR